MTETAQRPGHIPGAKNVPWATAVAEDGTFKPVEELQKIYGGERVFAGPGVVSCCRSRGPAPRIGFSLQYFSCPNNFHDYDRFPARSPTPIFAPLAQST